MTVFDYETKTECLFQKLSPSTEAFGTVAASATPLAAYDTVDDVIDGIELPAEAASV